MEVIKSQKISIFEVLDYIFCPRIIYYENVLKMFGEKKEDSNKEEEESGIIENLTKNYLQKNIIFMGN